MNSVVRVGRISVNMALLERVRQVVMCIAIALLVVYVKPFPVAMAVGSLLGIVYVALAWRQIEWRDWWVLVLLEVFYLIAVLNVRGELDPNMHFNTNWAELQLGFLLIPFMFIGLRPKKSWGTTWVLGSAAIFTAALMVATFRSFQTVDGVLRFIPYPVDFCGREGVTFWKLLRAGYTYFSYEGLSRGVAVWPMYMSYCFVVSMLIVLHRLYRDRNRVWLRILLCVYFLIGVFLCNARMMYVCLALLGGMVFLRMLVKRSYRPIPMYALVALMVGVAGLFLFGSRGGVVRMSTAEEVSKKTVAKLFEAMVLKDYRINLWVRTWQERDAFLPWGLGSGECGTFIKEHYYDKYGDLYGNHYENLEDRKESTIVKMHNMCIDTVVEQGYVGLLYLLFMLVLPLTKAKRMKFVHVLLYVSLLVLITFESVVYSDLAIYYFCMVYCSVIAYSVGESPKGATATLDVDGRVAI